MGEVGEVVKDVKLLFSYILVFVYERGDRREEVCWKWVGKE